MKLKNKLARLEARRRGYEVMIKNSCHGGREYTKPGSIKK